MKKYKLNQDGNTLMWAVAIIALIGSGTMLIPDLVKNSKQTINNYKTRMAINQYVGQVKKYMGQSETCIMNLKASNLKPDDFNGSPIDGMYELTTLKAVDNNSNEALLSTPGPDANIIKGRGRVILKSVSFGFDLSDDSSGNPIFDPAVEFNPAKLEFIFLTKENGIDIEITRKIDIEASALELDTTVTPSVTIPGPDYVNLEPGSPEATVVSCNGSSINTSNMANLCKTLFGGVFNASTGRCDYLLITDRPCVEYDSFIPPPSSVPDNYNSNKRKCNPSPRDLGYQINIAPRGCEKGWSGTSNSPPSGSECEQNLAIQKGVIRVNNEFDVDGAKIVHCDVGPPTTPPTPTPPAAWGSSTKQLTCSKLFPLVDSTGMSLSSGVLLYNLKSLTAKDIESDTIIATGFFKLSDIKTKSNIHPIGDSEVKLLLNKIRPRIYKRKGATEYGFIAQEVAEVFPDLVGKSQNQYLTVSNIQFLPVMIESVKSDNTKLSRIDEKLKKLERLENE